MIYITTSIEPENDEEFEISNISIMRIVNDMNEENEYKYQYGGWIINKEKEKFYFSGYIYSKRENNIIEISSKIYQDILQKWKE
jgi:hypothetical protein